MMRCFTVLKQIIPTLSVMVMPFFALAQQESRNFYFTDIIKYHHEALNQSKADRCRINFNAVKNENSRGFCDATACEVKKKHMAGHCGCPPAGRRLVDGTYYTLLNPCEDILLYKRVVNINKWTSIEYYFGKGPDTPVIPLTKENLKKAYSENPEFQTMVDVLFRNNSQLSKFDRLNNTYLINWLYTYVNAQSSEKELAQ